MHLVGSIDVATQAVGATLFASGRIPNLVVNPNCKNIAAFGSIDQTHEPRRSRRNRTTKGRSCTKHRLLPALILRAALSWANAFDAAEFLR